MDTVVHALTSLLGSVVGTVTVPAITAGIAWKYRAKLWGMVQKQVMQQADGLLMSTELGKRVQSIDEKLTKLVD